MHQVVPVFAIPSLQLADRGDPCGIADRGSIVRYDVPRVFLPFFLLFIFVYVGRVRAPQWDF
jgi:hypothetical protein